MSLDITGKTFLEKSFPQTPFKRLLEQGLKGMLTRGFTVLEVWQNGSVRSTIGDPDLRSPSGFDSGLRPPLRMTRKTEMVAQSLDFHRIYWIFGVAFKIRFYAGFPALFF